MLGPAVAIELANSAAGAAEPGAHHGFAGRFIAMAFDPTWNLEHRVVIFAAIMGLLFLSGVGLPLPEDIPLTLAGFTTIKQADGHFVLGRFLATFAMVVIPILLGDLIAYGLGRRFGLDLRERIGIVRRTLTAARLARVQAWFDRYGAFAVFLGRQVAGVRFVTFFTAGSMRLSVPKFLAFDLLGCVVSVPVWLTLGALASRYGELWLHASMRRASFMVLVVAVLLIVVLAVVTKLRSGRAAAAANQPGDAR
ncbi:MAG TPA: DedA family protein [Polyangiaceae bacterium]|nr:DedA family protein [Polyangiaceae bacterium]